MKQSLLRVCLSCVHKKSSWVSHRVTDSQEFRVTEAPCSRCWGTWMSRVFLYQDALSLLAENAELEDEDGRGVAFRRAAAVLKALPEPTTSMTQLRGLPCLGEHSLRVIRVSVWTFDHINEGQNISTVPGLFCYRTSWRTELQARLNPPNSLSGTKLWRSVCWA